MEWVLDVIGHPQHYSIIYGVHNLKAVVGQKLLPFSLMFGKFVLCQEAFECLVIWGFKIYGNPVKGNTQKMILRRFFVAQMNTE